MKITVIGKAHISGISKKTGKPFDFINLHYIGKAYGVEGDAALTSNISSDLFPYEEIIVGDQYDLDFDNRGNAIGIFAF